jgi:hypothetical protein
MLPMATLSSVERVIFNMKRLHSCGTIDNHTQMDLLEQYHQLLLPSEDSGIHNNILQPDPNK